MKLPKLLESCTKAIMGRAERVSIYMYGAEFLMRMLREDREDIVTFTCDAVEVVFPDDLTQQARACTAVALVLSAINATMEAKDLEEQFGDESES